MAHVGSKDVFEQVQAGPYTLFVTVRMPNVIPGVATVEVRASGSAVSTIAITPMPLTGEASRHPPTPDAMTRSKDDPAFFTGGVWMMAAGSWQVRLAAPGAAPNPALRRHGLFAMAGSLALMALILYGGAAWWKVDAASFSRDLYSPLATSAMLQGDTLDLRIAPFQRELNARLASDVKNRANDDFLPDHGHLIHLYAIRWPEMDAVFHLHPAPMGAGEFKMQLPSMPPGGYRLYGDVVHANGFPETLTTTLTVPGSLQGTGLAPEDAEAHPSPVSRAQPNNAYTLPDGYRMVWTRPAVLTADTAYAFHFSLLAPDGQPATGMQPYLGMAGHAAFVKTDGTVFAHTHPEGSAAMASLMLANGPMEGMPDDKPFSNAVDFPYGFPSAGQYRIFIQMKHGGQIETGVFDATVVSNSPAS